MSLEMIWFAIAAVMVATYVVLDGFDFGAGILHLFVAKTESERRSVFAAIGPFWDGNEVWLLAGGGIIVFAFPRVYAAGFSGFYMPLTMVLWLLILRGISIEFRPLEENGLWRSFWDGVFFLSSSLMAIVLGAALGNVIRGVPLDDRGYFSGPLFSNWVPGRMPGVLDWYTVLVGLFTLTMLAMHGALFLRMKTEGDLNLRATAAATRMYFAAVVLGVLVSLATASVQPNLFGHMAERPLAIVLAVAAMASLVMIPVLLRKPKESLAFLASCSLIVSMLAGAAASLYPTLLASTLGSANDLTVGNSATPSMSLGVGLYWWIGALILAVGYFVYLFTSFRGKVTDHQHA